jgi:hypothetical protein
MPLSYSNLQLASVREGHKKNRANVLMLLLNPYVRQSSKVVVFTLPLIIICCFILLKILSYQRYENLVGEDYLVENLQSCVYFLAFAVALFAGFRFFRTRQNPIGLLYLVLAFGLFFIAMEEISWGQRIFNIATPTFIAEHNYQEEISLHNFGRRPYINLVYTVVGFIGAFAWLPTRVLLTRIRARYHSMVNLLVPPWYLAFYFFPAFVIYFYLDICVFYFHRLLLNEQYVGSEDQEPAELLLALGFLLLVIINVYKQSSSKHSGFRRHDA